MVYVSLLLIKYLHSPHTHTHTHTQGLMIMWSTTEKF